MRNSLLTAFLAAAPALLVTTARPIAAYAEDGKSIEVAVGSSSYQKLGKGISRVIVGDAEIASVTAFEPDQLLVSGLRPGHTTATVWVGGEARIITIDVGWPLEAMRDALRQALPDAENLDVVGAGNALILSGQVGTPEEVERAEAILEGIAAGVYDGGSPTIVDAMTLAGAQQVQLEVSFAEVSRSSLREIGLNFWSKDFFKSTNAGYAGGMLSPGSGLAGVSPEVGTADVGNLNAQDVGFGSDGNPITGAVPLLAAPLSGAFGFVFSSTLGGFPFSAALSLMSSKGYARTLAEPTLVAMSGKSASFLAGGEFPVPLPQSLGSSVGVEYRKFGIQLTMAPTVSGDDIQLDLGVTVSDVDLSIGVSVQGTSVPGLRERHSQTTVRLADGQSFVIAGLISDEVRSTVDKVPLLGDLPLLGALFKSSAYRRQETELMVVVTAHLVQPLDERPALPGETMTVDPSDLELFLLNRSESLEDGDSAPQPKANRKRRKDAPVGAVGFAR